MKPNPRKKDNKSAESEQIPGYPIYPAGEDIYNKQK